MKTLKHMVASGLGITVLPRSAAELASYGGKTLVVRDFIEPVPKRTIAIAWRVSYPRHQAIDTMASVLRG